MTIWASLKERASNWIEDAATGLTLLLAMVRRSRKVELIEHGENAFLAVDASKPSADRPLLHIDENGVAEPLTPELRALLARSSVEVILAPSRFIFRSLELPQGARQFLDGVVRSQIDRLTPWSANEAAFGWTEPTDAGAGQIGVTVAATARARVAPIAQAAMEARADQVRMSTLIGEGEGLRIPVFAQDIGVGGGGRRMTRGLVAALALAGLAFVMSLGAWLVIGGMDDARVAALEARIAERRAELMNRRGPAAEEALKALQARKWASPSAVMTVEALSKTLPDDAHLTELRIEAGKVEIAGSAVDPPSLIRLIEQSRRFTQATFSAPTVKSPSGGQGFHIEAHIAPSFPATN